MQIRLAFGKVSIKSYNNIEINLIDYIYSALKASKPSKPTRKSSTILSFLDISIKVIDNHQYLMGFYGYALGEKYKVIDEDGKTIDEEIYPQPPFRSKALFLITDAGFLIIEEKTEQYIKPEKIRDALVRTIREFSLDFAVYVSFLKLAKDIETMIEFVKSLKVLTSIQFSNIRHSNPNEKSKFLDEASDARVDDLIESSKNFKGIDKENSEFIKNQIEHAQKRYAEIKKAEGLGIDGYRVMELVDESIRLTITVKDKTIDTIVIRMINVFNELLPKLLKK